MSSTSLTQPAFAELNEVASEKAEHVEDGGENLTDPFAEWDFDRCPGWKAHPLWSLLWLMKLALATSAMVVVLSVIACIPIINLWVLGYMLELQGSIAIGRTGEAFRAGLRVGQRLVGLIAGAAVMIFPLWLLSGVIGDARLINPSGSAAGRLGMILVALQLAVALYITIVLCRSGRFIGYLQVIRNGRWLLRGCPASESELDWRTLQLRLWPRFRMGVLNSVGVLLWLVVPTLIFQGPRDESGEPAVAAILGGALLIPVLCWLPILQARFTTDGTLRSFRQVSDARAIYRNAPASWIVAIVLSFVLTVPYTIGRLFPELGRELQIDGLTRWLAMLIFVATMLPAHMLLGWAHRRALHADGKGSRLLIWIGRVLIVAVVAIYLLLLFLSQTASAQGAGALFDQTLFLMPLMP